MSLTTILSCFMFLPCFSMLLVKNFSNKFFDEEINFDIVDAFKEDRIWNSYEEEQKLGEGSAGVIYRMFSYREEEVNSNFDIRIGDEDRMSYYSVKEEEVHRETSVINKSLLIHMATKVLLKDRVPFIPDTFYLNYILMGDLEDSTKLVFKILHVFESIDEAQNPNKPLKLLNILNVAKTNHISVFSYDNALLDFFHKIVYTLKKIHDNGFIHGGLQSNFILIQNCKTKIKNFCPFIANSQFVNIKVEGQFRNDIERPLYSSYYRPPEMEFFTYDNSEKLLTGPLGFKLSGKEDVFALGVIILETFTAHETELDSELERLLERMLYPITVDMMQEYLSMASFYEYEKLVLTTMSKRLDDEYISLQNKISILAKKIIKYMNKNKIMEESLFMELKVIEPMSYLTEAFQRIDESETVKAALIEEEQLNYYEIKQKLNVMNPFENILNKRPTMDQVLLELFSIKDLFFDVDDIEEAIETEFTNFLRPDNSFFDTKLSNLNYLSIVEDTFKVNEEYLLKVCERFKDTEKLGKPILYLKKVEFKPDKTIKYRNDDFCYQVLDYLKIKQINKEEDKKEFPSLSTY